MDERPMTPTPPETDDELLVRIQGRQQAFLTLTAGGKRALPVRHHMSSSMTVAEDV
jgi:hypothetical protein